MVLGLEEAASGGAEVEAMHALLERLELRGRTITMDAAGTSPATARLIHERGGHYLLALKANHRHLHEDVAALFVWGEAQRHKGLLQWHEHRQSGGGHGRYESRRVVTLSARVARAVIGACVDEWTGLHSVVLVERTRTRRVRGEQTRGVERAFFLCSLPARSQDDTARIGAAIRAHWAIENSLHWGLDVVWGEDACRVRRDHAPKNLALLKRMASNIMRQDTTYDISISLKRKTAAWNPDFLLHKLVGDKNTPLLMR